MTYPQIFVHQVDLILTIQYSTLNERICIHYSLSNTYNYFTNMHNNNNSCNNYYIDSNTNEDNNDESNNENESNRTNDDEKDNNKND